jgi:sialate O-acetylesterase
MKPYLALSAALTLGILAALLPAAPLLAAGAEKPTIELGAPFSDRAILQRGMPVPVWGWSKPGAKVTLTFAGQTKTTEAGRDGKWMAKLEPLEASAEPREMTVTLGSGESRVLKDILVGEVWMASGQSNMQWLASKSDVGQVLQKQIEARVAAGEEKPPVIRETKVTDFFANLQPIEHASGEWHADGGNMSAVAYAFAYQLHRELGVPVGILNCSFSQTAIQAWTPREGFAAGSDDYSEAIHQRVLESDPSTPEHKAAWEKFYQGIENTLAENKQRVARGEAAREIPTKAPGILNDNRDATWLFNARINPMIPYAIRGCIWNQGYANMNEGIVYYNNLHSMIRGWRERWGRPELPVYFHQFYCPGQQGEWDNSPSVGGTAEMRLGTWLARDIPHTGMASQIDIQGAIHYGNKTLPGQRLALHALKNQYAKDVAADGPMFKSYEVKGNELTVTLDHAGGGLVVAETGTNSKSGLAIPTVIPDGTDQVKLFHLAGGDRVWHPARIVKIDGDKVIVSSPAVKEPRGVSYATGGVGNQPNLYNKSLLPTTPFIQYDHKLVTRETWPDDPMKIAGVVPDPNAGGLMEEYRKMPLCSTQFRKNAVLQADVPVTIWGSAIHDWGYEAKGKAEIQFSFAGVEKTIPVTPGMREWSVTLPPMKATSEPQTLKVTFTIDGELAREHIAEGIVFGDVWYVAAPALALKFPAAEKPAGIVRMMTRKAKGSTHPRPRRFSVATSTTPENRFASYWEDATGEPAALAARLATSPDRPVGVIFMQTVPAGKGQPDAKLKEWIAADCLNLAPSLMDDYKQLAAVRPGNDHYDANARRYVADWKKFWAEYVPEMISTKRVPDGAAWGRYPTMASAVTTTGSHTWNVLAESFTPGAFKGILFLSNPAMVADDKGALFGEQMSALANCMKKRLGGEDTPFYYTIPSKSLAPEITKPSGIKGRAEALEITDWQDAAAITTWIGKTAK